MSCVIWITTRCHLPVLFPISQMEGREMVSEFNLIYLCPVCIFTVFHYISIYLSIYIYIVVQSLSHVQLCNPMDCSTPGPPVPHHLLKFAQVHVHCISDAIQPSHPLMPSSPFALNLSQHQGLFQ